MNLREKRQAAGVTQKQLANQLGVDPTTIGRWERQEYPIPKKQQARLQWALAESAKSAKQLRDDRIAEVQETIYSLIDHVLYFYGGNSPARLVSRYLIEQARKLKSLRSQGYLPELEKRKTTK